MPRSVDYSKGLIYKICCKDPNIKDIYVGSTTNFKARKYENKSRCNNENGKHYNLKVYKFIRDNGGWDNWDMVVIKEFSCENKRQLEREQRKQLEELNATLNNNIPTRTHKQYREDNKEEIKEKGNEILGCMYCRCLIRKCYLITHMKMGGHPRNPSFKDGGYNNYRSQFYKQDPNTTWETVYKEHEYWIKNQNK
tara:strand:+ start:985 stop:1569 length:585 start_codon:yes stop_codon:yes gene_type:complete